MINSLSAQNHFAMEKKYLNGRGKEEDAIKISQGIGVRIWKVGPRPIFWVFLIRYQGIS